MNCSVKLQESANTLMLCTMLRRVPFMDNLNSYEAEVLVSLQKIVHISRQKIVINYFC